MIEDMVSLENLIYILYIPFHRSQSHFMIIVNSEHSLPTCKRIPSSQYRNLDNFVEAVSHCKVLT